MAIRMCFHDAKTCEQEKHQTLRRAVQAEAEVSALKRQVAGHIEMGDLAALVIKAQDKMIEELKNQLLNKGE